MDHLACVDMNLMRFYVNHARVKADVNAFINSQVGRNMRSVDFSSDRGRPLLHIFGTIPIVHHGVVYNIPMALYITEQHPYSQPEIFVTPTPAMRLNDGGPMVGLDGRVRHDDLTRWNGQAMSLHGVFTKLAVAFGSHPPVSAAEPPRQPVIPPPEYPHQAASTLQSKPPARYGQDDASQDEQLQRALRLSMEDAGGGGQPNRTRSVDDPEILRVLRMSKVAEVNRKILQKLAGRHSRSVVVITDAAKRKDDLQGHSRQLDNLQRALIDDKGAVDRACLWFDHELPQVELQLREFEGYSRDMMSHEKTVIPTAPLYGQYIKLRAQSEAIEDTLRSLRASFPPRKCQREEDFKVVMSLIMLHINDLCRDQFRVKFLLKQIEDIINKSHT